MERYCSKGQSPQQAVAPTEEEVRALLMGGVIAGFPEFAVLNITDATEDGEVICKKETGRVTNRIANVIDEDIE